MSTAARRARLSTNLFRNCLKSPGWACRKEPFSPFRPLSPSRIRAWGVLEALFGQFLRFELVLFFICSDGLRLLFSNKLPSCLLRASMPILSEKLVFVKKPCNCGWSEGEISPRRFADL